VARVTNAIGGNAGEAGYAIGAKSIDFRLMAALLEHHFDWSRPTASMDLSSALRNGALSAAALLRARELGVCVRCCLRFAAVDDSDVYACVLPAHHDVETRCAGVID
jgi:hypothetical protein